MGDYSQPSMPEGLDLSTLSSTTVTISFEIGVDGSPSDVHISKSSGNSDVDRACEDVIRQTKYRPAIQDHIKLRSLQRRDFNFSS